VPLEAVPSLVAAQLHLVVAPQAPQAVELPSRAAAVVVVAPVAVPIHRVLLAVAARRLEPRASGLRKKHKTYWWGGFGNRTAGTRSYSSVSDAVGGADAA